MGHTRFQKRFGNRVQHPSPIFHSGQGQDCLSDLQDDGRRTPQPESGHCILAVSPRFQGGRTPQPESGHCILAVSPRFQGGGLRDPLSSKHPDQILSNGISVAVGKSRISWSTLLTSDVARGFLFLIYLLSDRHDSLVQVLPTRLSMHKNQAFLASCCPDA